MYSGAKGHGQCVQVGNITDTSGHLWCITPGTFICHYCDQMMCPCTSITTPSLCHFLSLVLLFRSSIHPPPSPGFQASSVPRCGDGAASAQLGGMVRRAGHTLGFRNLFRGTPQLGAAKVVDLGYVYEDRNTLASARDNGNPTVRQQAVEVQYNTIPCNGCGT